MLLVVSLGILLRTPDPVTYATSIAPILNRSCLRCHREGGGAPFSLQGFEQARKWSPMISAVTKAGRMPPWRAKPAYNEFFDENRLTKSEIELLRRWAEEGSHRGDIAQEPEAPRFDSSWPLGKPDLVLQPDSPFRLESEGKDSYRSFVLRHTFKKRVWLRAIDFDPGSDDAVHHIFAILDGGSAAKNLEAQNKDGQPGFKVGSNLFNFIPSGVLGVWGLGTAPREYPEGTACLIEPGSTVVLQIHYQPTGKVEVDQTKLALYFANEPPKRELKLEWVINFGLAIPADSPAHEEHYVHEIEEDLTLYGIMPHMHLLGRSMRVELELPTGDRQPLIWVDEWDMKWQLMYRFLRPVKAPKGSKIHSWATFDNSSANPLNPNNPPKLVKYGKKTRDEMQLMVLPCTVDAEHVVP